MCRSYFYCDKFEGTYWTFWGNLYLPMFHRDTSRLRCKGGLTSFLANVGEICEDVSICGFSDCLARVPARRGFALRDAIEASQSHNGTYLGKALGDLRERYDRLIVITDDQAHDAVPNPKAAGYVINVASYKNGVGYERWTHIDGWSESVIEYIRAMEDVEGMLIN